MALAALKKDAGSFAKGSISVLADLLGYRKTDGGFSHTSDGPIDQMSTEQAAYALVAYDRYKNNKKPLYDMSDVFDGPTDGTDTDHTIHASADAGGTISPVGDVTVPDGAKQSLPSRQTRATRLRTSSWTGNPSGPAVQPWRRN